MRKKPYSAPSPSTMSNLVSPMTCFLGPNCQMMSFTSANLNWYQAAYLAQDAGGYLASITSDDENSFVFNLVSDQKYFWSFPEEGEHHGISIGPFLGGYQPEGSPEPAGGWCWAVGSESFVKMTKELLGADGRGRKVKERDDVFELREGTVPSRNRGIEGSDWSNHRGRL